MDKGIKFTKGLLTIVLIIITMGVYIYWRMLSYRQRHDLPVPQWYQGLDDLAAPFKLPFLLAIFAWIIWQTGRVQRVPNRPQATVLSSDAVGVSHIENSQLAHMSDSDRNYRIHGWSVSRERSYAMTIALVIIVALLEFLRQVILPVSINAWIDTHHTLILQIILGVSVMVWIYDGVFYKLATVPGEEKKTLSRRIIIPIRIAVSLLIFGALVTYYCFDPIINQWRLDQISLNTKLLIGIFALLTSLLVRRRANKTIAVV